ncbi:MAG: NfeD family protein [Nocardioides sp.]|jgi:membrane protein implicated in regulation of membrane protease activity
MDWLGDNLWAAWAGAAVLLGVAEMLSLDLVLIMVAVGAVAGMVMALVGAPVAAQVLVAAAVSVAMLGLVRPTIAKRFHGGPELTLGHGKLVGQRGVVTEEITDHQHGRIKLAGEIWSAAPYDENVTITPGETVEVLQIKGATAYVHPVPRLEA